MADRYWVGGTGSWDATTTHWSATSGGAGGASVPTSADNVFFNSASNGTSYTVTVAVTSSCANLSLAAPASGSVTWGGSSALSIYGDTTIAATGVNLTYSGTITFRATVAGKTINTNGVSLSSSLTFVGIGGTWALQGALTTPASRTVTLTNGTLDLNGFSLTCGLFSATGANTRTLTTGGAAITVTGTGTVWSCGTLTSMTYTTIPVVNVTSTGATAITVQNGTGGVAENLSVSYNFTGGTYALTLSGTSNNIDFTGYAGNVSNNLLFIYGNLTLSTGWTRTAGANAWIFRASTGPKAITTAGRTLNFPLTFSATASAGAWQLQDALTMGNTIDVAITNGTLDLNGKTLTTGTFTTNAGTKDLTFNGGTRVCVIGSIGGGVNAFNNANPTGFTTTAGTGVGAISLTGGATKTFVGGGSIFNCTINNAGSGALTISGANTFSNITNTVQPATVLFTSATTNTFAAFSLSGTAGNLVTIGSTSASSHTLSKASGTVSANYLSISYSTATGGATWNAANSVDGGNNSGWIFAAFAIIAALAASEVGPDILAADAFIGYKVLAALAASEVGPDIFEAFATIGPPTPPVADAIYLIKLRSFTERRRF